MIYGLSPRMSSVRCVHCDGEALWSRFFDDWWCPDCRVADVTDEDEAEVEDEMAQEVHPLYAEEPNHEEDD